MATAKEKWTKVLIIAAGLNAGVLLISNLAATKLWDLFGIAVDGGIIVFPILYILGDVVVEVFGKERARTIIFTSFAVNLLAVLVFMIVQVLPPFPDWGGQEAYETILGFTPRIVCGSLLAYVAAQLLNNFVFEKIRAKTGKKRLFMRALGSSVVAHAVDSGIFETVAFFGVLGFSEFLNQAVFAWVAGMAIELMLTPLTYAAVGAAKKYIGEYEKLRG